MNSEELELSLRSEFESHLKTVVAGMRQEFSQLQEKVEAEFDKHKSQMEAVFQDFSARLENRNELEAGFSEMVVEHLRLARDEGARVSATAFEEAQRLEAETAAAAPPKAGIAELSMAISDITAQDSQATILKSLVQHAAQFTPRGAFFIIKNEHFVGWRVFGKEGGEDEQAVREVFFPVASSTTLGESVRSLSAVESSYSTYSDDSIYLNKLQFGHPERMYAIPLVARGRGVAVLYADYGTQGEEVNIEALETLVRIAGLTVEVLAAAPIPKPAQEFQSAPASYAAAKEEQSAYPEQTEAKQETEQAEDYSAHTAPTEKLDAPQETKKTAAQESETVESKDSWSQTASSETVEKTSQSPVSEIEDSASQTSNYQFGEQPAEESAATATEETTQFESQTFEPVETSYADVKEETPAAVPEPALSESAPTPSRSKSRFSDRNVDLPIEVGEDERRLHNDARRFARLLVSEIKLYNEQKVKEGREAQDLYERLREAIDRSRDMYDKRVQPPVAAKFDYFHYELVSSLAEGEEGKLGGSYPGSSV